MSTTPDTIAGPEYTDEEILAAWSQSGPSIINESTMLARFRAFLAALPSRQQASEAKAEPAQTWTPENAKAFEAFQAELRETWDTQPWTPAVGDVVQLKSGGPRMTCILRHARQDTYLCSWVSNHGGFERFFPLACLMPAKES